MKIANRRKIVADPGGALAYRDRRSGVYTPGFGPTRGEDRRKDYKTARKIVIDSEDF